VVLPPDSLLVLHLPKVYAAPSSWVKLVHPAAAAAVSAAAEHAVDMDASSSSASSSEVRAHVSTITVSSSNARSAGATVGVTAAAPQAELSCSAEEGEPLLPLMPAVLVDTIGSSSSNSRSDAVCCWSAWLKAGSWLYPAAVRLPAVEQQK
jgi:hypothetical protein